MRAIPDDGMGATRTIELEPIVVDSGGGRRTIFAPPELITGTRPPTNWWPWIVGAIVLGGIWYLAREW